MFNIDDKIRVINPASFFFGDVGYIVKIDDSEEDYPIRVQFHNWRYVTNVAVHEIEIAP